MEVPFSFVDFLRGKLKLNRLDQDADRYLLAFLEHSKFKNYKREVCMKLAYHYYLIGDEEKYSFYRDLVATYPKSTTNRDREADVERERPYEPHREILKARHLVSGEYYERAFSSLSKVDTGDLDQEAYLAEYFLLKGKVKSNLSDDGEAMEWYEKAIEIGRNSKEQYAAEAALYAGMEAQAKGEPGKAIDYWELALKINGQKDVYIEYIHDKANNLLSKNGNGKHARYQAGMANVPGD
jgi:tetratricopeptide (TPR) repeat protein